MDLKQVITELTKLEIQEKRSIGDDYGELVLLNTPALHKLLSDIFGPAVKKSNEKPDKETTILAKEFGGIWDNQTLFKKNSQNCILIAMLWPWGDQQHITIKIAIVKPK
jgi:hypothetical protein